MSGPQEQRWVDFLAEEDLAFVKRFILCSGSLKDLATAYDVSYPTLRLRLDRLIQKVKVLDNQRHEDTYERMLGAEFADADGLAGLEGVQRREREVAFRAAFLGKFRDGAIHIHVQNIRAGEVSANPPLPKAGHFLASLVQLAVATSGAGMNWRKTQTH